MGVEMDTDRDNWPSGNVIDDLGEDGNPVHSPPFDEGLSDAPAAPVSEEDDDG